MFNHKLPSEFPMQTLRKKTSPLKYKNEPGRFLGEGVSFRAKLIGVLEVPEARGDRMCQEALADLKMAIRAAGEHKQRIQVHVAIDGLRLRDDKTGDSLYHHPVHKISFIAQDMTDSRAFGYIFGSPDTGHRFFGIKTDKAASQVVIAMRDLFQVVFELKKKEVEMAKQQLEGKTVTGTISRLPPLTVEAKLKQLNAPTEAASTPKNEAEGGVAELVDLEQELSSLRRGLTQVEGLTPNADPFGDSFTASAVPATKGLLPPPPSGSSSRGRATPASSRAVFSPTRTLPLDLPVSADFTAVDPPPQTTDTVAVVPPSVSYDVFTELDPLGTGRSKPYVDKKLFFQELKNPPKKVLKDLVPTAQLAPEKEPKPEGNYGTTTMTSLTRHSGGTVAIVKPPVSYNPNLFESDPFAENDPFDNADPFSSDCFKEDPFSTVADLLPKTVARDAKTTALRDDVLKARLTSLAKELSHEDSGSEVGGGNVYNGPLQVFLPPEPAPKSPRLSRQSTESSSVRQRPQPSRLSAETASPPPPLPPKKPPGGPPAGGGGPPPRPPHDAHDADQQQDVGPPLPKPARKKEPKLNRGLKPRECSERESSDEEYLPRPPPPLPAARRLNITLAQLLTCSMEDLADRLRVPAQTLSCMTLPQLTDYLRSYLAADNDRARIHVEPPGKFDKPYTSLSPITTSIDKPPSYKPPPIPQPTDFKPQFEDNFAPGVDSTETFVANFEDFDKKVNSYDKYAAFREIQEQELKSKSILDPVESPNGHVDTKIEEEKDEPNITTELTKADQEAERKELSKSPLKSLDELTLDSFNMFRNSVSPKPSQIDAKIEDIKSVMKNLQIEKTSRSVTPRESNLSDLKIEDNSDRYAALREITITEPSQDEFESIPPEIPKERKRSDEKSDGFDNSDFFDCIDNSSLSFTHVEEAFRKSPVVKEREEEKKVEEVRKSPKEVLPVRDLQPPVTRLSTGSISDVASASSPDTKDKRRTGDRWAVLGAGVSPWSSDSRDSDLSPRPRHSSVTPRIVQTSSSSRDVSPWEEEPPRRPPSHSHTRTDSRQNSSGSRECLDSGSGREKDRRRGSRDRERETKDTIRDRRDSGSGRDRRDATHRRRDKRSRDRDIDLDTERDRRRDRERDLDIDERRSRDRDIAIDPDRERTYSRDRKERDYRDSRSRERPHQDHRDKERIRHRKSSRHSYDENDYSDGCGSGRSSPRDRWSDRWRRDDRNYGSLGWRESRRRNEVRQIEESDRRYGSTVTWSGRRRDERRRRRPSPRRHDDKRHRDDVTAPRLRDDVTTARHRDEVTAPRHRDDVTTPRHRDDVTTPRHRDDVTTPRHRDDVTTPRHRDDVTASRHRDDVTSVPRHRDDVTSLSRHRDDVTSPPRHRDDVTGSKVTQYSDEYSPAPSSGKRKTYSSFEGTRFTFDPEESTASPPSAGPRSQHWWWTADSPAFEDDFTTSASTPRGRNTSIAEEDEDLPPLPPTKQINSKDIKKSESVNIFTQQSDPFENDAFFACTGSDKAARRDNWPGDFHGFDNA